MVSLDCIVVIGDDRVRVAQIHLEYFQAPSICFVPSSVLALFGAVHIRSALHSLSVHDPYPCTLSLYVHSSSLIVRGPLHCVGTLWVVYQAASWTVGTE